MNDDYLCVNSRYIVTRNSVNRIPDSQSSSNLALGTNHLACLKTVPEVNTNLLILM